jgi:hypothetical protein
MIAERTVSTETTKPINYNEKLHIDDSKITQNVNIFVDTRTPGINDSQISANYECRDPEVGQEMQSSNGKEIVLTKTSLPAIRVGFRNTSINVLRPFPSRENPPSLNEKISPFMGPHIEIEEIQSSNSNISLSRLSKGNVEMESEKLCNISKLDPCDNLSPGSQTSQQGSYTPKDGIEINPDNMSWLRAMRHDLASPTPPMDKSTIRVPATTTENNMQHGSFFGFVKERPSQTTPARLNSIGTKLDEKKHRNFGMMVTDKNYANIRKFIGGKDITPSKFGGSLRQNLAFSPESKTTIIYNKKPPPLSSNFNPAINITSMQDSNPKCLPIPGVKTLSKRSLLNSRKNHSRPKSAFSSEAITPRCDSHLVPEVLSTIDQGVILVDEDLCHIYNNISHLNKKAGTFTPGLGELSPNINSDMLPVPRLVDTVWDSIFNMDYIATKPKVSCFREIFVDYEGIILTGEYTCLRQLLAVYKYVRPGVRIAHMEKIHDNIQAKKKMGLCSSTDVNVKIGDFVYHRDGLSIEELMRLMKAFIKRYTTDDDNKQITNKNRMEARKTINKLLKGGNLEFCFVYKSFTITISIINLQIDKSTK